MWNVVASVLVIVTPDGSGTGVPGMGGCRLVDVRRPVDGLQAQGGGRERPRLDRVGERDVERVAPERCSVRGPDRSRRQTARAATTKVTDWLPPVAALPARSLHTRGADRQPVRVVCVRPWSEGSCRSPGR